MKTYEERHAKRYDLSLRTLKPFLVPNARVLCLGEVGAFEVNQVSPLVDALHEYKEDLRNAFFAALPAPYDVVLCMEVFEHIHDQDADKPTEWYGTGTANLLTESLRVLKPDGVLFLTTPNAASLNVLHKVLMQFPPMVYRPHVREYAPHELAAIVKAAGFDRIEVTSHDCWDNDCMSAREAKQIAEAIVGLGYRSDCRGEDLFLIARKPK